MAGVQRQEFLTVGRETQAADYANSIVKKRISEDAPVAGFRVDLHDPLATAEIARLGLGHADVNVTANELRAQGVPGEQYERSQNGENGPCDLHGPPREPKVTTILPHRSIPVKKPTAPDHVRTYESTG